ncbi:MAG: helix-turn-helix transcriptional regulator [Patescibacteria group bacterium]|nr:helix-turn-helix transcriptional regulator [Patescibacteria group bacterium]
MPTIADNIRKARKKKGLSQDKLAHKADVAHNTVVKIESGENQNPTIETLRSIARALDITVDELIN